MKALRYDGITYVTGRLSLSLIGYRSAAVLLSYYWYSNSTDTDQTGAIGREYKGKFSYQDLDTGVLI